MSRQASEVEKRLGRLENAMLRHINSMATPIGAPIPVYVDQPVMKKGKPTEDVHRVDFICPVSGTGEMYTHILGLDRVQVQVHHREDASRFTDFALVFEPLHLLCKSSTGREQQFEGGPFPARIEFKTSDNLVFLDVRLAGRGGELDTAAIPDSVATEVKEAKTKKSASQMFTGMFKSAMHSTAKVAKGRSNFQELRDDDDQAVEVMRHDEIEALRVWLYNQVALPLETIIKRDIEEHKGKGY
mmetsp:Transcript_30275/g.69666  ORF Transcript_30275/g.69666 Transcript_30275/m.69666 type:complete len:243 (+) Transcript_30275:102-830(+)